MLRRFGQGDVKFLMPNRSPTRCPKLVGGLHLPSAVCPPSGARFYLPTVADPPSDRRRSTFRPSPPTFRPSPSHLPAPLFTSAAPLGATSGRTIGHAYTIRR